MKRLFLLFLISISYINAIEIDEYKTDVYFANGILTNEGTASSNTLLLKLEIIKNRYGGDVKKYKNYIGKVKEAYNETHFAGLGDLVESLAQKLGIQGHIDDLAAFFEPLSLLISKTSHDRNLETQIKAYKESIQSGHKVLVVAHSQGNLFTYEAREKLLFDTNQGWMSKYFQVVSIASPAMFSIPGGTPLISWDNDLVAWLGLYNGSTVHNPVRKVDWERLKPEIGLGTVVQKPTSNYVEQSQIGKVYKEDWKAYEGVFSKFDSVVHAFTFYMGENLAEGKIINPFDGSILHTDKAKSLIMNAINEKITELEALPTQWKPKNLGCLCKDKYAKMTHIYDPDAMNKHMANEKVKDFREEKKGKIYRADAGGHSQYVRALDGDRSKDGVFTIDEIDEEEACYVLRDDASAELGKIEGKNLKPVITQTGAIETTLSWDHECDIDMNLTLEGMGVLQDIKDIEGLGLEHAYVPSEGDIFPGLIEGVEGLVAVKSHFYVYGKGGIKADSILDESELEENPVNIYALIKTPSGTKFKQYEAQSFRQLNLGMFAEIEVNAKGGGRTYLREFEHDGGNGNDNGDGGVGSGGDSDGQDEDEDDEQDNIRIYESCPNAWKKYTCLCVPCEYIIHGMDAAVEYGPIGGADVEVIRADTYGSATQTVVYRGKTTNESDLFKSGLLKFSQSDYAKFEDDVYYVVEAKGGDDLDRDDDLVKDVVPTKNNGTIHAIIKGSDLKTVSFRVNALTEAIYQTSGELLGSGYNVAKLELKLETASKKLFREKTFVFNNEIEINYHDTLLWAPGVDKKKLFKDYDTFVEPLVVKTYTDEPRIKESYRLIYEKLDTDAPQLTPLALEIPHTIVNHSIIGKVNIASEGISGIDRIELKGDDNSTFSINSEGLVKVVDASALILDALYKLDMTAVGADGKRSISMELIVKVIEGVPLADLNATVPTLESIELFDIVENSVEGTVVAQANFVDSSLNIVAFTLRGEDNDSFVVDNTGEITVANGVDIDYEKSDTYSIKVSATNEAGNESFPVEVSINVRNEIDTPLHDLVYLTHLSENVPIGTVVGKIVQVREGRTPITSFDILNPNVPFALDVNGTIRTTGYIDYESVVEYNLLAMAKTDSGNGNKVEIQILITNVYPETGKPSIETFTATIDENLNEGVEVGQLSITQGASEVELVELRGTGHSNFTVDVDGTIVVASGATLDYEQKETYDLQAIAYNINGSSLASVTIHLNNLGDEAPTLLTLTKYIEENATSNSAIGTLRVLSSGEGNITGYTLRGIGSENFSIDENGTIRVSSSAVFDYETTPGYTLQATVISDAGESEESLVRIYILNIAEHIPVLKLFTGSVEENASIGTVVGQVEEDSGGDSPIVSYALDDNSTFSIDNNGTIKVNATLDYELQETYTFGVTASNKVGESKPQTVIIDINDTGITPTLLNSTIIIEDTRELGAAVGQILVDSDGDSPILEMKLNGEGAEEFKVNEEGVVSLLSSYSSDYAREYNLLATANNKFGISDQVEVNIIVKPLSSSVTAGSDITVLEHQAFFLQGKVGETNSTEVLSYQWYSPDTNKIDCDGDSHECLVSGLEIGEYEAIFSVIYKNGEKHDDSIMIKVINNPLNNILGTLQEGLEGLKDMRLSKDGTKMYVIGDFEDDIVFKIVDVSDVKEMKIISTYVNSDIGNNVSSFALNEDESKVAIAGGQVVVLDISDPIAIKYISGRNSHATKLARLVQWYKDDEILIYNYNRWSEPYYTILIFDIYQMNSGAIKEFVLDTSPRDFLVLPNKDILVVGMSNKLKVFDINKSTMLYETDKGLVDNIVLSELNSKVYYNYEYYKIAGLDISNKTAIKDINLSEKAIFDYQSLYDVNDSSGTLYTYYAYSNSYSTINKISIQDLQHQYVGDTTYIKGKIQQIEATKDQKSAFVYSGNGLQAIDIKNNEYKGQLIDNLNVGYLVWSHNDSYAYASGFIYDCRDIFNITNIGEFSVLNSCYPDCGEGEEGGSSSLMLSYFYLSSDDSQISFMYTDTNGEKKYASIDVSDKSQNNFMQLDDSDPWENVSRFTISKNERYVYSGYKEEDINGVSYFGIMVLDRDTQDKQYFRVGENEGKEFAHFVLSNNEEKLYALLGGSIVVFDIQDNKKITAMNHIVSTSVINAFTLGTNQNKIFALTESGLDIIDTANSKIIYHYATIEKPKNLSISSDGSKLAISMGNVVEIVNILNQEVLTRYGFIWYPSFAYGSGNISFKSNTILFSEGYIINLEE